MKTKLAALVILLLLIPAAVLADTTTLGFKYPTKTASAYPGLFNYTIYAANLTNTSYIITNLSYSRTDLFITNVFKNSTQVNTITSSVTNASSTQSFIVVNATNTTQLLNAGTALVALYDIQWQYLNTTSANTDATTLDPTNTQWYGNTSTPQTGYHTFGYINNGSIIGAIPTALVPQDIWMAGQYTYTFTVTDSSTGAPISGVVVSDSGSRTNTTGTNGVASLTEPFGAVVVYFTATGYSGKAISYIVDSDASNAVQLTVITTPQAPAVVYIPQQIRFKLVSTSGYPLEGVTISATPINFTAPANWTETLFGISPSVNIQGATVYGDTGSDGSWVAPMLSSQQYSITMTRTPDVNYNVKLSPSQTEYLFMIPLGMAAMPTPSSQVSYSLENASIDDTHQYINMTYDDTSTQGTNILEFTVVNLTGATIASASYSGTSANSQSFSQIIPVSQGQSYTYAIHANQSEYGWINQSSTVTLANQIALIGSAPSWVEEWIAIALIIIFAAGFSIWSKPFALIAIPILTWYFQYMLGWLPATFMSAITLGVMLTIGVLMYIRQAENKIQ